MTQKDKTDLAAALLRDAASMSKFEDCEDVYRACLAEYNQLIDEMKEADNERA